MPAGYDEHPERRYPVVYEIPGFGGTYWPPQRERDAAPKPDEDEVDFIRVYLSGDCKWGHHVYADSATNGPAARHSCEMIPHIDSKYRTVPQTSGRFVTGHSSGGWSSLWLQVSYPDTFGGCWSTSPDPVDFRDFQQVDLYAEPPLSLYYDPQGAMRPIGRRGTEPFLWFAKFGRMDNMIGRGGQLRSFEAVFSPPGPDGLPQKLWDRQTGQIDPAVAKTWEKYDIRLLLERNWPSLGPQLAGKLNIITGELDTLSRRGRTEAQDLARDARQRCHHRDPAGQGAQPAEPRDRAFPDLPRCRRNSARSIPTRDRRGRHGTAYPGRPRCLKRANPSTDFADSTDF